MLAGAVLVVAEAAASAVRDETSQVKMTPLASNLSYDVDVLALDSQQRIVKHNYMGDAGVAS